MTAFSVDAEEGVIGSCMLDDQAYWTIAGIVGVSDFHDQRCRALFELIGDLVKLSKPVDPVTIGELITSRRSDKSLFSYVLGIANSTPSALNIKTYAEIVAKKAVERRVVAAGAQIASLYGDDALSNAQAILAAITTKQAIATKNIKSAMKDLVKLMKDQAERDGALLGVTTGLSDLDEKTLGLCEGDLVIIAGRPSMGKTLLAICIAMASAKSGLPAHFFTLEMSTSQCLLRIISAEGSIPHSSLRDAKHVHEEHWHRIANVSEDIGLLPLYFDESIRDLDALEARIIQLHATNKTRLVVIDQLSHIPPPKADRSDLAIQEITRRLKALAKRLNITVVLVCQLNRSVEARADKKPVLSDLRESGAIEQDADMVLMPYRDEYYHPDSPHKGYAEILIRKQRNGEVGSVPVLAELAYQRFADAPDGLPSAPVEVESKRGFQRLSAPKKYLND